MSRLFEYEPTEESALVDRILVRVHRAVDDAFPRAQPAQSRRFAKTVFADEPTVNQMVPGDLRMGSAPEALDPHAETKDQLPITVARGIEPHSLSFVDESVQDQSNFSGLSDITYLNTPPKRRGVLYILGAVAAVTLLALYFSDLWR